MKNDFTGKIILLTGAGSGIGRAVAQELGRRGSVVVVTDFDGDRAAEVAGSIQQAGGQASSESLNVVDADAFKRLVKNTVDQHGRLDYLFNNAGVGVTGEVRDLPKGTWNHVIDVNLRGVIHGIEAAYPQMIHQRSGHIFNMACIAGLVPFPMTAPYCATKHAVVALSTALRAEAAALGVKVSVVCPGTVDTGMFEAIDYFRVDKQAIVSGIGPALMPVEKCARAILTGVQRNRAIITITLHARLVWWLYRLAPRVFLWVTARSYSQVRKRLRTD